MEIPSPLSPCAMIEFILFFFKFCIGEAMEQGLRDCCRSIRIGKILIQSDEDTHEAHVVYAKFPEDISSRKVLLMYPIMS
ncbi:UNVERIFIED_CONTAM: uprt [Trichonephila clavipes]